jgi:gliding motility associated protien GldN
MKRLIFALVFYSTLLNVVAGKSFTHKVYFKISLTRYNCPADTTHRTKTPSLHKKVKPAVAKTAITKTSTADPKNFAFYHSYTRVIEISKNQVFSTPDFNNPDNKLIDILFRAIKAKKITAYERLTGPKRSFDASFVKPLTFKKLQLKITDTVIVPGFDNNGTKIGEKKEAIPFDPRKICGYALKEVVYLNKQTQTVETRIVGLAPIIYLTLSNGDTVGTQPLFWLNYKQSSPFLATIRITDPDNNLYDISLNDILLNRRFDSKITEESNPKGLSIKDYVKGADGQDKESMRIEDGLTAYKNNFNKGKVAARNAGTGGVAKTNLHLYHTYYRELSMEDPRGQIYNQPNNSLFKALVRALKEHKINAYTDLSDLKNVADRPFTGPLNYKNVMGKVNDSVLIAQNDANGNQIGMRLSAKAFQSKKITAYRLKEIVYVNKAKKTVEVKIIGIAPVETITTPDSAVILGTAVICWFKYDQCRSILSAIKVTGNNKSHNIGNLDKAIINQRSDWGIIEESNPQGLRIIDYVSDKAERPKEAARIEKKLTDFKNSVEKTP